MSQKHTVYNCQVTVQIVGNFWFNTNGITLTTSLVKISPVTPNLKERTHICTTRVMKGKGPIDGGKDGSCGFPLSANCRIPFQRRPTYNDQEKHLSLTKITTWLSVPIFLCKQQPDNQNRIQETRPETEK
jgi:hypothetical protein